MFESIFQQKTGKIKNLKKMEFEKKEEIIFQRQKMANYNCDHSSLLSHLTLSCASCGIYVPRVQTHLCFLILLKFGDHSRDFFPSESALYVSDLSALSRRGSSA